MDPVQPVAAASTVTATAAGGCAATEAKDLQGPDALVCEILEMQMDKECKGIDYSSLKIFTDNIFKELPSLSPEVRVEKLRCLLDMMKKNNNMTTRVQSWESADPDRRSGKKRGREVDPVEAVEHSQESQESQPLAQRRGDCVQKRPSLAKQPRLGVRIDTEKKMESFRAFAVTYMRENIHVDRKPLLRAYQDESGIELPTSIFKNRYLLWQDLIKAARGNNTALAPISRKNYETIEEAIADSRKPDLLRDAADWCIAQIKEIIAECGGRVPTDMKRKLLARIGRPDDHSDESAPAACCARPTGISLSSQFRNCVFSIAKLNVYCRIQAEEGPACPAQCSMAQQAAFRGSSDAGGGGGDGGWQ